MSQLNALAGETGGPYIFTIATATGFPTLDLDDCTITLRFSRSGVGLVDLTVGDGLTVAASVITATLTPARTTAMGVGVLHQYTLIIETAAGAVYVPEDEGTGTYKATGSLPSAA
jgi:hypothetical protein